MDVQSISAKQHDRIQKVQNLLATGFEQLTMFYFELLYHGLVIPGSTNINCYICREFHLHNKPMELQPIYGDPRLRFDGYEVSTFYCTRCGFAIPWPCGDFRSKELMETMRYIADGGMSEERDIPEVEVE